MTPLWSGPKLRFRVALEDAQTGIAGTFTSYQPDVNEYYAADAFAHTLDAKQKAFLQANPRNRIYIYVETEFAVPNSRLGKVERFAISARTLPDNQGHFYCAALARKRQ